MSTSVVYTTNLTHLFSTTTQMSRQIGTMVSSMYTLVCDVSLGVPPWAAGLIFTLYIHVVFLTLHRRYGSRCVKSRSNYMENLYLMYFGHAWPVLSPVPWTHTHRSMWVPGTGTGEITKPGVLIQGSNSSGTGDGISRLLGQYFACS